MGYTCGVRGEGTHYMAQQCERNIFKLYFYLFIYYRLAIICDYWQCRRNIIVLRLQNRLITRHVLNILLHLPPWLHVENDDNYLFHPTRHPTYPHKFHGNRQCH